MQFAHSILTVILMLHILVWVQLTHRYFVYHVTTTTQYNQNIQWIYFIAFKEIGDLLALIMPWITTRTSLNEHVMLFVRVTVNFYLFSSIWRLSHWYLICQLYSCSWNLKLNPLIGGNFLQPAQWTVYLSLVSDNPKMSLTVIGFYFWLFT